MTYDNYSVLMSVYFKEKSEYLRMAMDSIWNQTVPTDDFVLVCDGPLSDELDSVIEDMQQKHSDVLHVIRLEKNGGLGNALNEGIKYCKNELVARMDSDDISRPDRCEKQLKIFNESDGIDICSGTVEEFETSIDKIESRRVLPEKNDEIVIFAKKRNPFNHPCVMYKKTAVEAAGGYQDFYLLEDYYLWVRMIQNGAVGYNTRRPLLWMRAGKGMHQRRSGLRYVNSQVKLFLFMREKHYISTWSCSVSIISRLLVSIVPNRVRICLYSLFVR